MAETRAEDRRDKAVAKRKKLQRDNAIRAMLQHSDTREYLRWLLDITRFGQSPFMGNNDQSNFSMGEQNVGLQIFAHIVEVDLDGYVTMAKEEMNERPITDLDPDSDGS